MTAQTASALRQAHIEQIQTLFNDPPSLLTVAQDSAQAYLDRYLAALNERAGLLYIATPEDASEPGTWRYASLPQLLVQRLASARPLLLVEAYHRGFGACAKCLNPPGRALPSWNG